MSINKTNEKNIIKSTDILFPIIDGHFWVERDGKIIDPYFQEYDFIKKFQNLTGDIVYLEAEQLTQKLINTKFNKILDELFGTEAYKKFRDGSIECKRPKAIFGGCYQNSVIEIANNGGILKFGSMGWKRKSKAGIHYEFGGEGWKFHQFLMKKT